MRVVYGLAILGRFGISVFVFVIIFMMVFGEPECMNFLNLMICKEK